ncbi:MAG: AAA family ATPase [Butyrivibrio sp.]
MKNKIITISREYGSGGRFIGEEVAKELGFAYYDKDIIFEVAKQTGFASEYLENNAELAPKTGLFAYSFVGRDSMGRSIEDMVYEVQRKVILELPEKGSCVIIGRNADYILRDRSDVLNVFIHGNTADKIKRIRDLYHVDEKEALRRIREVDKRRAANYRFYTEKTWGASQNYTLSLNSSELGYEKCMEIIKECV